MIKKIYSVLLLIHLFNISAAQDILVLKKDESELKCRISSVNDTLITYQLWESTDKKIYSVKRAEVLSFLFEEKNIQDEKKSNIKVAPAVNPVPGQTGVGVTVTLANTKKKPKKQNENENAGNIGKYKSGETVSGYVVTNKKDTLWGFITVINVALNQLEVKFTNNEKKTVEYNINDLIAYGYDDVRYEKVNTGYTGEVSNNRISKTGEHFLNVEVDGPAKLFRFYTLKFKKAIYNNDPNPAYYFGKLKYYFLITNPHGKQLLTKGRTIKGCVNSLFSDNKELMEYVRMNGVKAKTLPLTVKKYNDWFLSKK